MASLEKVTVDKAYFDALLRRADFHTSAQIYGRPEPPHVSISKAEYDSLCRTSREFELLKAALFQGGITAETIGLLISGVDTTEQRKDSGSLTNAWAYDFSSQVPLHGQPSSQPHSSDFDRGMPWRQPATFNVAPGSGPFQNGNGLSMQTSSNLRVPALSRQVSYGAQSSVPDEAAFDDAGSIPEEGTHHRTNNAGSQANQERRTLYFAGLSDRTTYRDLLSVIKGGRLLGVNLRSERSATVTFLDGAAEFLAWAKRNDIYLHSKRLEVRWAERQYRLNGHIHNKILNGATRNIMVHNAHVNGLTESRIREDMEHIHNLVIIDVTFRNGDAYISTNSVHNALFARTCMMSRTTYKGCKVEFLRDECDVPLPAPAYRSRAPPPQPSKKKVAMANRFDIINMDGTEQSSDEENRTPVEAASDDEGTLDLTSHMGVSLNFLDTESN
ncbi:hypothetical protein B0A55_07892 [Friedmanniomyces simplex]|uniref:RRM domain-containing protein n=1 Tax=Friedmanniomyces simplex TaxID=329884 RepID=A0A4U0X7D5_9PEZI|nr:hypothetical protein B0A55_07892 [Friedmanniomyces simplex]